MSLLLAKRLGVLEVELAQQGPRARHRAHGERQALVLQVLVDLLQDVHVALEHLLGLGLVPLDHLDVRQGDDRLAEPDVQPAPLDGLAELAGVGQALVPLVERRVGRDLHVQLGLRRLQAADGVPVGVRGDHAAVGLDRAGLVARHLEHLAELVRRVLVEAQEVGVRRRLALVELEEPVVELLGLVHLPHRVVALREGQADRLRLRVLRAHLLDQLLGLRELAAGNQDLRLDQRGPVLLVGVETEDLLDHLLGEVGEAQLDEPGGELEVLVELVGARGPDRKNQEGQDRANGAKNRRAVQCFLVIACLETGG